MVIRGTMIGFSLFGLILLIRGILSMVHGTATLYGKGMPFTLNGDYAYIFGALYIILGVALIILSYIGLRNADEL